MGNTRADKYAKRFQHRLPRLRELRDLNQVELADRAGMMPGAISQFESGTRAPSFESIVKLADALDISADYLMGRDCEPVSVGPTVDKLAKLAEQLPDRELDLLYELAKIFSKRNKERLKKSGYSDYQMLGSVNKIKGANDE